MILKNCPECGEENELLSTEVKKKCSKCGGDGRIKKDEKIEINILPEPPNERTVVITEAALTPTQPDIIITPQDLAPEPPIITINSRDIARNRLGWFAANTKDFFRT